MKAEYLPEEVVTEILRRLPVKSVLRCTCICKLWYSLIKSSNFINTHLQRTVLSSNNSRTNRFLLCMVRDQISHYSLRFDNNHFNQYMALRTPFDPKDSFAVAGSCNGLICLVCNSSTYQKYGYRVIIWNPVIRKSRLLPPPNSVLEISCEHFRNFMGFGFDSITHDYKVLRILKMKSHFRVELYSLNLNSWKDITHIAPNYGDQFHTSAFVNGALHWIVTFWNKNSKFRKAIMAFDVSDEVFHEIWLPECLVDASTLAVKVYGESSIAVIHHNTYQTSDVWVMKEYGVVSSWVKLATVGKRWRGYSHVVGFRNDGEALIDCSRGQLASQNLNSGRTKTLMAISSVSSFHSYVESLVLLDKGDISGPSDANRAKTCN